MNSAIIIQPLAPLWAIGVLGLAAGALALLSIRRSLIGACLRLAAAAALTALVLNPQLERRDTTPLNDVALLVVDESASQLIDDREAVAADAAAKIRDALAGQENLDVRETSVAGDDETRLGDALAGALGAAPRGRLAAVFVITDGRSVDAFDPGRLPEETPLHVLYTGRPDERDRKITLINAPRYGIVNSAVDVSFRIDDLGPDDEPANEGEAVVTLRVDGEQIVQQSVPVGAEVRFAAPLARPGKTIIELEASPRREELSTRNNTAILPISAIRDRLRVLLISGEPHAGERVWRNLLKSDPAIDLVHFTILRPAEKQAADGFIDQRELALIEFPQDELFIEKLSEFDLVIFDRYTYQI